MFELPPTQLAGMRLQQALMIFRDIWRPVIDTYMRQHFGDVRYVAHLKSLHQSDRVFIDFDAQGVVQLDVSAIIYLLLEDGGLRPPMQSSARHPRLMPHPHRCMFPKCLALPRSLHTHHRVVLCRWFCHSVITCMKFGGCATTGRISSMWLSKIFSK